MIGFLAAAVALVAASIELINEVKQVNKVHASIQLMMFNQVRVSRPHCSDIFLCCLESEI